MFPKKWAIVELIVTWLVLYFVKLVVTQTTRKPLIHPPQIYQWKLDPVLKLDNKNSYIYGGWIAQEVLIVLIGIKDPPRVNSKGKPLYSNPIMWGKWFLIEIWGIARVHILCEKLRDLWLRVRAGLLIGLKYIF